MTANLRAALSSYGIDYDDAMDRFGGNAELFFRLARKYLDGDNYARLVSAMEMHDFDEAYRQAHSLKGVAGNLSFTKLYNIAAEIVSNLREGESSTAPARKSACGCALRAHIPRNHAKEREPAAAPMRSAQQDTRSSRACTRPKCARATKP